MFNAILKPLKTFFQIILWVLSLTVALMVIAAIAIQGFAMWLNTDDGNQWITTQANQRIAESGYSIEANDFGLSGIFGLRANQFKIMENGQTLIEAKKFALRVNPAPLSIKHLDVKLSADTLNIENRPTPKAEKKEPAPITLPDLYFKTAQINIDIKTLHFSDKMIAGGFDTYLKIKQNLRLADNTVHAKGWIKTTETKSSFTQYLPEEIQNTLDIDLTKQIITVEELKALQNQYEMGAKGQYGLADKQIQIALIGEWLKPENFNADLNAPITLDANINGKIDNFNGKIAAAMAYQNKKISLNTIINRAQNIIALKDIKAQGGPVNITGALNYNIETKLADGQISTKNQDLKVVKTFIDTPSISGILNADVKLFSNKGKQAASLNADVKNLTYQNTTAKNTNIKITANDISDALNAKGEININALKAAEIDIEKTKILFTANDNQYDFNITGNGKSYNLFSFSTKAKLENLKPLTLKIASAQVKLKEGSINASGELKDSQLNFKISGKNLIPAQIPFADLSAFPIIVDTVDGTLNGTLAAPTFDIAYKLHPSAKEEFDVRINGQTQYATNTLTNKINGTGRGIDALKANLDIPLTLQLQPFAFNLNLEQINGAFDAKADLQPLSSLVLDEGYIIKGDLNAQSTIKGGISNPILNGTARLKDGYFNDTYNDIELLGLTANATLNDRTTTLTELSATDKEKDGSINASGTIVLDDLKNPDINAKLAIKKMHLPANKNYNASINANLALKGTNDGYVASGKVWPEEISIRLPEQIESSIPELNIVKDEEQAQGGASLLTKTKLDIVFEADNRIFVSGRGLDTEWEGKLNIIGNLKKPLINGNLKTIRGRYKEFGRRFDLEQAILRFQGTIPPSPYLDIIATTKVEDIIAKILITNSVQDLKIKLTAEPAMPEDQVLSLILFGKNIEKISTFQALRLANTLRKFSGQGGSGFDPLQSIQDATGLDDVRVDGIGTENARVGAGKYISEKVYVEVEQGTKAGSTGAAVQVELTPNVSLESKTKQDGESDVGVFWEWNY